MRSQRDLVVAAASILFASVACGNDKSGGDARPSGGQTSTSSGGTHETDTTPASSDVSRGSGGTSGSLQTTTRSSSDDKNSGGGALGTTTASGSGGQPDSVSGGATGKTPSSSSTSTGGKGSDASGGKSASATGGKSATGNGGATSALGGSAPKGGSAATSATQATGGNTPSSLCTTYGSPAQEGTMGITTNDKTQISGIVASRDNPGILYAQADSGQSVIHAMDTTGKLLGSITLSVTPKDWEDLSIGVNPSGTDYLYVGDIGDNAARTGSGTTRSAIVVYRFAEPAKTSFSTSTPTAISSLEKAEFTYPGGAHDAETLIVDPTTQDLLILTKDENGKSIVYRAPDTAFKSSASTKLEEVATISTGPSGQLSSQVSAGDISPSGDAIILRTYGSILLFPRLATWAQTFGATPVTLPSPTEQQGEGLTFTSDGKAWICAGETSTTLYSAQASCK